MEDEKIIELFFKRSQEALNEAREKYDTYCRVISTNILSDKQDSEECLNDAYLKLWNSVPPEKPKSLKAYLGRIVRNLSLDRLEKNRAQKRGGGRAEAVFEELSGLIGTSNIQISETLAIREAVNDFLRGLDKESRVIFVQRYWYFCSIKEIASQMEITESKVKMRLSRTKEKLRKHLQKEGFDI